MWEIINETPFAAKGAVRQDFESNQKVWLVAVKATLDIHSNGTLSIAETQEEVFTDSVFYGDEEQSSLRYDSDLFALKDYTDLILNGTGYQPKGLMGEDLLVGFSIGSWEKILKIVGDRLWDRFMGFTLTCGPQPFSSMPIVYEKAYGGLDKSAQQAWQCDHRNTVGTGYAHKKPALSGKRLPNIEYPDFPVKPNARKNKIAGFGALPSYWKPRIEYAGTFDDEWRKSRAPLMPLDFSSRFYQSAPTDQQVNHLSGGERISLINLMPAQPKFTFFLPDIEFSFTTKIDMAVTSHQSDLKTVIVEPDIPRLILVWQTAINCQDREHLVDKTIVECDIRKL